MFRTARGFLLAAPPAFLVALVAFLAFHPRALDSYTVYPVLSDVLGPALVKRPMARFVATSGLFFLLPYLVTGLLLFFADLGLAAAAPLWTGRRTKAGEGHAPLESRIAFFAATAAASGVAGALLHRVAHGGELPGRISVAPVMVAMIPFGALLLGLLAGALAGVPRLLFGGRTESTGRRKARPEPSV